VLSLLQVLVEAAHLICVNFAAAAPLVAVGLEWRERRTGDPRLAWAAGRLAIGSLWALAAGAALGIAIAGLWWLRLGPGYTSALRRLPTERYVYAALELAFYVLCVGTYAGLLPSGRGRAALRRWLCRALAVAATTNVLYHFPPLFAVLAGLRLDPTGPTLTAAELKGLRLDPLVLALMVHHALAALAIAGVGLMLLATRLPAALADGEQPPSTELLRIGAWTALVPTLLEWVAGVVVLAQLSPSAREVLLGGDVGATALFALALLTSFALLHVLAAAAVGPADSRTALRAAGLLTLVVVLMVGTLQRARAAEQPGRTSAQGRGGPVWACASIGGAADA
jgi:hypothetical protein